MTQTSTSGFIRTEANALKDTEALRLRSRGMTYRDIAGEMGVSLGGAYQCVQRALAAIPQPVVDEYRKLELEKLDKWEQATVKILERFHPIVTMKGDLIVLAEAGMEDGEGQIVLGDDEPAMKALHTLMKIQDQRAKLLGLYAPARSQVEITTYEGGGEVERELERLAALLESSEKSSAIALPVGEATSEAEPVTA